MAECGPAVWACLRFGFVIALGQWETSDPQDAGAQVWAVREALVALDPRSRKQLEAEG